MDQLWFYGKLLLGVSPVLAIGLVAFCHRDDPEVEAERAAKEAHCRT